MQTAVPITPPLRGRRGPDHLLTDDLLTSQTGRAIAHANEQQRHMRNGSLVFDPPERRELKLLVRELAKACATPNWDGEGAAAVDEGTLRNALRFIDVLPMGMPEPEPAVHPDGEMAFSWIGARGHRLSVAVGPTGRITFAFRRLPTKLNGTEFLGDRIPDALLKHIVTFIPRR